MIAQTAASKPIRRSRWWRVAAVASAAASAGLTIVALWAAWPATHGPRSGIPYSVTFGVASFVGSIAGDTVDPGRGRPWSARIVLAVIAGVTVTLVSITLERGWG